jgi:hypothetical protein
MAAAKTRRASRKIAEGPWPLAGPGQYFQAHYVVYYATFGRGMTRAVIFNVYEPVSANAIPFPSLTDVRKETDANALGFITGWIDQAGGKYRLARAGRSKTGFAAECYPNARSAEMRWGNFSQVMKAMTRQVIEWGLKPK